MHKASIETTIPSGPITLSEEIIESMMVNLNAAHKKFLSLQQALDEAAANKDAARQAITLAEWHYINNNQASLSFEIVQKYINYQEKLSILKNAQEKFNIEQEKFDDIINSFKAAGGSLPDDILRTISDKKPSQYYSASDETEINDATLPGYPDANSNDVETSSILVGDGAQDSSNCCCVIS